MASLLSPQDLIDLGTLAYKAFKALTEAGSEYAAISGSLSSLQGTVKRIEDAVGRNGSLLDKEELVDVVHGSKKIMDELNSIIYPHRKWRVRDRVTFSMKDLEQIRLRLDRHYSSMLLFLNVVQTDSLTRIESKIDSKAAETNALLQKLVEEKVEGLQKSYTVMSKYGSEDPRTWQSLRRKMIGAGLESDVVERYESQIIQYALKLSALEEQRASLDELGEYDEDSPGQSESDHQMYARRYSQQFGEVSIQGDETQEFVSKSYEESHTIATTSDYSRAWQRSIQNQATGVAVHLTDDSDEDSEAAHGALDLSILKGLEVQADGYVLDAEGNTIGQLTVGDAEDLEGYPIGDDGEILDEDGDLVGIVQLLRDETRSQFEESSISGPEIYEHGQEVSRYDSVRQQISFAEETTKRLSGSRDGASYHANNGTEEEYSSESEQGLNDMHEANELANEDVYEKPHVQASSQRSRSFWKGSWTKKSERVASTESYQASRHLATRDVDDDVEQECYSDSERHPDYSYEDEEPSDEVIHQATSVTVANERPRSFWKRSWGRKRAGVSTSESQFQDFHNPDSESQLQGYHERESYAYSNDTHSTWATNSERHLDYYYEDAQFQDESMYDQAYEEPEMERPRSGWKRSWMKKRVS